MKMPYLLVVAALVASCAGKPLPVAPTSASADDFAVAKTVLPALNENFPYRMEKNPDPKDPLGVRRMPTDHVVVKPESAAALPDDKADEYLAANLPAQADQALRDAWKRANDAGVLWPPALMEEPEVIPFTRIDARITDEAPDAKTWWEGLAKVAPMASALVTLSRPGYVGDRALVSARVETGAPSLITYYYLLVRDKGAWVVTNSLAQAK